MAGRDRPRPWLKPVVIVGGLGVLGVIAGLVYSNLSPDGGPPPPPDQPALTGEIPAPEAWAGVGYLPADCNAIVAARPARMRVTFPDQQGGSPGLAERIEGAIGLGPDQIAEVVVGLRVDSGLVPKWVAVLTTLTELDPKSIRNLGTEGRIAGRSAVRTRPEEGVPGFVAWRAGPRTLVLADDPDRFAAVPEKPEAGIDRFSFTLRDRIRTKIADAPLVWAVADTAGWEELPVSLLVGPLIPTVDRTDLAHVESLAVSLASDGPSVTAWVGLDDEAVAAALRDTLTERLDRFGQDKPAVGGAGKDVFARLAGDFSALRDTLERLSQPDDPE